MTFHSDKLTKTKLVMWEKTDMPESKLVETNGKKSFEKTGKTEEMTTYTFRDGFGEKLVILTKDNSYRALEGEMVDLSVGVVFNDFQKKNRVALISCKKSDPALDL